MWPLHPRTPAQAFIPVWGTTSKQSTLFSFIRDPNPKKRQQGTTGGPSYGSLASIWVVQPSRPFLQRFWDLGSRYPLWSAPKPSTLNPKPFFQRKRTESRRHSQGSVFRLPAGGAFAAERQQTLGLGFRVWGLGFGVWGLGFRV